MSISLRTCIVNCIPKGNKPREYLQNWRPISLLSVPYKIASLALANRLKTVLDCLISKTQSGFIQGRFIGDSTRLIYDLIHLTEMERKSAQLVLIDFEKAFDSVSWNFLFSALKFFRFGRSFQRWVKTFNYNIKASVIMSTPLGGGYIIFAFFAVRCPMSGVRRPMSGVTHGFRSFKGKVLELLSPNLVCRLIGSVACLGLLLAVVPLLLTE